jgi:hypothetical protein
MNRFMRPGGDLGDLYLTYSGEMPKKGYAVAFYG